MHRFTPLQRIERFGARTLLDLPPRVVRLLAGRATEREGQQLDLQTQLLLRIAALRGGSSLQPRNPIKQRRQIEIESAYFAPESAPLARVEDITVAGGDGPVAARRYVPADVASPAPATVFFHGGGFAIGSLDSHDGPCRVLADQAGCVVISVDYRLAPEFPAPAGVEDAIAAFRDIATRAGELDIDADRIAVAGDSAGGNLAAAVAQQTVADAISPCFQLLFYPTVDAVRDAPSINTLAEGFMLEKRSIDWYRELYLGGGADGSDPRISPIYGDTAGVAPALVLTAGFDPLRDEGEAYADKLKQAGVDMRCKRYPELIHGFISMAGAIRAARVALDEAATALGRALA